MKRLIPTCAIVLGCASAAFAAAPATLTTLTAIHALTNAEAAKSIPVSFETTVGYSRGYERLLFVQEGDVGIYVRAPTDAQLTPGDRVLISGITQPSFRTLVVGKSVTLLHHGPPPRPVPTTFDDLIPPKHDSMLVTVHALIRAADIVVGGGATPVRSARLQMLAEGSHFEVDLDSEDANTLTDLLDANVEITGVAAGKFDDKMQQTGVILYVSSLANMKVLKHGGARPWSLPITPMDGVLADYHVNDLSPRVRVHGTITYYQPGSAIVLQNGAKSLWIGTHDREPLQVGDLADATGFPDARDRVLTLTDGEIQEYPIFQPVTPQPTTWHQLGFWSSNSPDGHQNDLISIEGQVVTEVREASQDEYVLAADDRLFTAIYRRPAGTGALPPMTQIPAGSRIRVTGICIIVGDDTVSPGEEVPFNILLRSYDDISVVASPSLLNIRNLVLIVVLLLVLVVGAGARGWILERRVRQKTAALAARIKAEAFIERRRGRIIEDINGSRPVSEILQQVTELVSFKLEGAPCWCLTADGARAGDCPPGTQTLRIVREEIPAHPGAPLGQLFAALDPLTQPSCNEAEALAMGAGLITLAIDTRQLYSDLLHRSEFDLLTDIHNRFSFDKHLDSLVQETHLHAGSFGLIYVDLDEFKQVNDMCGHQVGDLYLQQATVRMKKQLRSVDMLARLGGDEFAVLVPAVHGRADVEEIALRLERCFDDPFSAEEYVLRGSASVGIAVFPEDALSKDGLLNAADASMYKTKKTKKQIAHMLEAEQKSDLTPKKSP